MSSPSPEMSMQPIHFWQHWRAVDQIYHDVVFLVLLAVREKQDAFSLPFAADPLFTPEKQDAFRREVPVGLFPLLCNVFSVTLFPFCTLVLPLPAVVYWSERRQGCLMQDAFCCNTRTASCFFVQVKSEYSGIRI